MKGNLFQILDDSGTECGLIWTNNSKITAEDIKNTYEAMKESEESKETSEPDLTIDNLEESLSVKYPESEFMRVFVTNVTVNELY